MILDRTVKPKPNGKIKFNIPFINTFKIKNGLNVYYIQRNTLPIVQVNLIVHSGSRFDTKNKNGLSKLTSILLDEGAGSFTGLEINNEIESLGSILNVESSIEHSTVSLMTLKDNLDKSMEIFSLIVREPSFNNDDFEREKEKLSTTLLQLKDDPSFLASQHFRNILFNATPYQFTSSGLQETITSLTNDEIKSFYKNNFLPGNSSLIIIGNLTQEEIHTLASKYFAEWQNKIHTPKLKVRFNKTEKQIILIDKPNAPQTELRIGHISKSRKTKDFFATNIFNSILGGQFSSRINLNLREDKGYTYGVHSSFNYNFYGGAFTIASSVKLENTGDAIKEILTELENIKTTISKDELDFSKSYLTRRYPSMFETYSQLAGNTSLIPIYKLELDYFQNYVSGIAKCTLDNVVKAAKNNINLDELVIVVVGNKKKIKEQIKYLDSFKLIEH